MAVTAQIEEITPARAHEFLAKNTNNRNIRKHKVSEYAGAMKRGEWLLTGEAIQVAVGGKLLDGQHRLLAVIESGVTIRNLVVRGLQEIAQIGIDDGAKRTFGDTLHWMGEKNTALLASALRIIEHYSRTGIITTQNHAAAPTKQQLLGFFKKHPEVREFLYPPESDHVNRLLTPSLSASMYYLFGRISAEDAKEFFRLLGTGDGLAEGDPIFALRRVLQDNFIKAHSKMSSRHKAALTIKAWNAWMRGDPVRMLRWSSGGVKPEAFPTIEGVNVL